MLLLRAVPFVAAAVELVRLPLVAIVELPSVLFDARVPAGSTRRMYVLVAWSFWPGE